MTQCVPADRFGALHLYDSGRRRFLVLSPLWCHELMARSNSSYAEDCLDLRLRFITGTHDQLSLATGGLGYGGFSAHHGDLLVPHPMHRREFHDRWLRKQLPTVGRYPDGFFIPASWFRDPEKWEEREIM